MLGNIGKKFSFNIKAMAGKAMYNSIMDSIIKKTHVIPGIGYAYRANNDTINTLYAYQYYSGNDNRLPKNACPAPIEY